MSTEPETRVYILGAGCSHDEQYGYPLAKGFAETLEAYGESLAGNDRCQRIRNAVNDTVQLLKWTASGPTPASTIDQLINLILARSCDEQLRTLRPEHRGDTVRLRNDFVHNARVATGACFLAIEAEAYRHQADKYRRFIAHYVFDGAGTSMPCPQRLRRSRARILSFNYDRLFELTLFGYFSDLHSRRFSPYSDELLNAGLAAFGEPMGIQPDRFCFLKLHGSIGLQAVDDNFGQQIHQLGRVEDWQPVQMADELFFPERHSPVPPMIVFPWEKDYIVSGQKSGLPFRDYIARVWIHAAHILEEASEVWVIGYSFDPTDCGHLVKLLGQAQNCKHIFIQNLPAECDRIARLLRNHYRITTPIEPDPMLFS